MSEALNANARMQAIRDAARAKAAAEVDRIVGRDRSALDAAEVAVQAANEGVVAARAHRNSLASPSNAQERRRGVLVDDWESARDDVRAAEAKWTRAAADHTNAFRAFEDAQRRVSAEAKAAASDALDAHLDALPEAMTAAVEHLEAIRALAPVAARPLTSLVGGDPIAAVDHLVPAIADAMRRAQRERAAFARDAVAHAEHVGPQAAPPAARGVDLDAINTQLAARK
ncbi:hypothetical protein [Curtobacterium pusillum]|uniref:hypothetical protein n=1 Tax=Curtobacterium pusillum TaxID=69373 RepID=UPI0011A5CC6C|nr:hypothetical protein [Curtobacterium pusillum]